LKEVSGSGTPKPIKHSVISCHCEQGWWTKHLTELVDKLRCDYIKEITTSVIVSHNYVCK